MTSHLPSVIRVPGSKVGHLPAHGKPWGNRTVCGRLNVETAVANAFAAMRTNGPSIWVDPDDVDHPCGHCITTMLERRRTQDLQLARMGIPGVCRSCGCTDDRACLGGCTWADDDHVLCSACADEDSAP